MNPVQVIGDADTVLAFALGSVPGHVVDTAAGARAAVDAVVRDVHHGGGPAQAPALILITHAAARLVRPHLDAVMLDPHGPLVLEIPGLGEPRRTPSVQRFVERVLSLQR